MGLLTSNGLFFIPRYIIHYCSQGSFRKMAGTTALLMIKFIAEFHITTIRCGIPSGLYILY
jgi:hypothetical protein